MRAAFDALNAIACSPLQRDAWYELQAVATAATASRTVAASSACAAPSLRRGEVADASMIGRS